MKNILGKSGLQAVQSLADRQCLFAFDFDGTLAPLVPHPDHVILDPGIEHLLCQLNKLAPVAIVTGRSADDVLRFFKHPPPFIIGNHGAEGIAEEDLHREAKMTCNAWHPHLKAMLMKEASNGEAWLEDKTYSITIHCHIPRLLRKIRRRLEEISSLPRLRFVSGIASINLLPEGIPGKGRAVQALLRRIGCERALFIGDDVTDEDVFSLGDEHIVTVRVGRSSRSAAAFFLPDQQAVTSLLKKLVSTFLTREIPRRAG